MNKTKKSGKKPKPKKIVPKPESKLFLDPYMTMHIFQFLPFTYSFTHQRVSKNFAKALQSTDHLSKMCKKTYKTMAELKKACVLHCLLGREYHMATEWNQYTLRITSATELYFRASEYQMRAYERDEHPEVECILTNLQFNKNAFMEYEFVGTISKLNIGRDGAPNNWMQNGVALKFVVKGLKTVNLAQFTDRFAGTISMKHVFFALAVAKRVKK